MTDREESAFWLGCLLGITGASVFMLALHVPTEWHDEIIKRGAAYYHPETGEFTWKEPPDETEGELQ